jgi:hypothetical protein
MNTTCDCRAWRGVIQANDLVHGDVQEHAIVKIVSRFHGTLWFAPYYPDNFSYYYDNLEVVAT